MSRRLLSALVTGSALLVLTACGSAQDGATENTGPAVGATTVAPGGPAPTSGLSVPVPPPGDKSAVPPVVPPAEGTPQPGEVPPGYTELAPDRIDTRALPSEYKQRRAWVSPDGLSLAVVGVASDSCSGVDGKADESAAAVRVVLAPMATPQGGPVDGPVCAQVLTERTVTVALAAPLGTRTVVLEIAR